MGRQSRDSPISGQGVVNTGLPFTGPSHRRLLTLEPICHKLIVNRGDRTAPIWPTTIGECPRPPSSPVPQSSPPSLSLTLFPGRH
jgi:hypothetical protein